MSLKDKVIIITGASSGLGEGFAYHFAASGSKLSLNGRNKERLEKVVAKCIREGVSKGNIVHTIGDLTDSNVRKTLIDRTIKSFGKIDVLINNAGILAIGMCGDTSEDDYRGIIETNQNVPFLLTQLALPYLKKSKGNIVNISSVAGHRSTHGITAYSMAKAALNMLTQTLALELAPYGVRANAVSPGVVPSVMVDREFSKEVKKEESKRHPLGRLGTTVDISEAVAFLASEKASWVTGEIFTIDGGRQCHCDSLVPGDKYKEASN